MPESTTKGPLHGIRVIEMSALGPVPFCAMMFSDLGAEVIKIDRAGAARPGVPMDQRFDVMSRGRRSIALDLKHPEGIEIVLQLVSTADVLIEGMRPGAMERLGLGPETCLARRPSLVFGRMTGWGQSGPFAERAGHDINYISLNGVLHSVGLSGGPPVPPINLVGDYGGGSMFLVTGVLAALLEVQTSGKGQVIDAAMLEGSSYLMSTIHMFTGAGMWSGGRGNNLLDSGAPFYRVYETSDGQYMAVGAIEPKFYSEFVAGLGLDISALPSPMDQQQWPTLHKLFAETFLTRSRREWTTVFEQRDACVTPVLSIEESSEHEQNLQRENFVEVSGIRQPNIAPRFSRTPASVEPRVSQAGAEGRDLLQELGLGQARIKELCDSAVVQLPE